MDETLIEAWANRRRFRETKEPPERGSGYRPEIAEPARNRAAERYFLVLAALAAATASAAFAYFFVKRWTRPSVSSNFCFPVKNGWQLDQISTRIMAPL